MTNPLSNLSNKVKKIRTRWNNLPLQTCEEALPRTIAAIIAAHTACTAISFTFFFAGSTFLMILALDNSSDQKEDQKEDQKKLNTTKTDLVITGGIIIIGLSLGNGVLATAAGYAAGHLGANLFLARLPFLKEKKSRLFLPSGSKKAAVLLGAASVGMPFLLRLAKNCLKLK